MLFRIVKFAHDPYVSVLGFGQRSHLKLRLSNNAMFSQNEVMFGGEKIL